MPIQKQHNIILLGMEMMVEMQGCFLYLEK